MLLFSIKLSLNRTIRIRLLNAEGVHPESHLWQLCVTDHSVSGISVSSLKGRKHSTCACPLFIQQIAIAKGFMRAVTSITKHWISEAPVLFYNAFSMRSPGLPCVMRNPLTLPAGRRSDLPPVSGLGTSHS